MIQRKAPDKPSQQPEEKPGEKPERDKIPTLTQAESIPEEVLDMDSLDIPILTDLIEQTGDGSDPESTPKNSPEKDRTDTKGAVVLKTGDENC